MAHQAEVVQEQQILEDWSMLWLLPSIQGHSPAAVPVSRWCSAVATSATAEGTVLSPFPRHTVG